MLGVTAIVMWEFWLDSPGFIESEEARLRDVISKTNSYHDCHAQLVAKYPDARRNENSGVWVKGKTFGSKKIIVIMRRYKAFFLIDVAVSADIAFDDQDKVLGVFVKRDINLF